VNVFLSGFIAALAVVITLFFFRFWRRTGDRFFAFFALAFAMMGVERCILSVMHSEAAPENYTYLFRIAAFGLIIFAIVGKNRPRRA
jgi:uncharacterized membrane protein HdeD (DUF308 family)